MERLARRYDPQILQHLAHAMLKTQRLERPDRSKAGGNKGWRPTLSTSRALLWLACWVPGGRELSRLIRGGGFQAPSGAQGLRNDNSARKAG